MNDKSNHTDRSNERTLTKCPICGSGFFEVKVDSTNLNFLQARAKEGKINASISLARIVWENVPELRLTSDSREVVDELSKTLVANTQNQLNTILAPMKMFIETFPKIIEKLPDDIRKDVKGEFQETRIRLESEFKTLREGTPTFKDTLNAMQTMTDKLNEVTERKMDSIKEDVNEKFKETLERMGFPEPEQMKMLSQLMPAILPLLEELLRFQKVPSEKGRQGEVELIQLLEEYYPEDDCQPLGGSGDTDALAIPRFNGTSLGQKVLIESKKNSSGWKRSFIEEVRNHMQLRNERFAILAVDVMPKNSNGFFFHECSEGVILVTDRSYFHVSYGAVRSALIALQPFLHRDIDFRRLFAEKKISEAIDEACRYSEWTKRLREKAQRIDTNTKGIIEDVNQLDSHLRRSLEELQTRINEAVVQIEATETKPIIAPS
jgi:hypothetical protein